MLNGEAAQTWHAYLFPGFTARTITWVGRQTIADCRAGHRQPSRLMPLVKAVPSATSAGTPCAGTDLTTTSVS